MLAIEGAVVTIDAMGCQRDIAQKVVDKKADCVLALKGNQGALREDVELFVAEQKAAGFKDTEISRDQTVDGDHGRIETRTTTVIHDVAWPRGQLRCGSALFEGAVDRCDKARVARPPSGARISTAVWRFELKKFATN